MSKHFRGADGSLLKADKSWSDLSNKQKNKIAGWMREAFLKHYPDDESALEEVFQKIDRCGIWIPDWEVIKRYNAKKPKFQKDLESTKAEEENALKRYNIIMVYSSDNSKLLFCKRKKPPYIGKLNFPGGKWEKGETFIDAAYRELKEETGIDKEAVIPLYHLMDLTYYNTNNLIECYVCRLTKEVELVQEAGGNELVWINIEGADFSNTEIFAGDGNILHCFLIAQHCLDKNLF